MATNYRIQLIGRRAQIQQRGYHTQIYAWRDIDAALPLVEDPTRRNALLAARSMILQHAGREINQTLERHEKKRRGMKLAFFLLAAGVLAGSAYAYYGQFWAGLLILTSAGFMALALKWRQTS